MKKNIVRIAAPEAPKSSSHPVSPEASTPPAASEQEDESTDFIPRPWVNVKPSFPWRPALIALSVILVVVCVAIFINLDIDARIDPQTEAALMAEGMPNLDRQGDPFETDAAIISEEALVENSELAEDVEAEPLKTLIVKVTENQIRANGKLVNLHDLRKLCENTDEAGTFKLINRRGDTKVVEAVARVLDSSQLRYHFVNN